MDTGAGDDCRLVQQAHGRQVQAIRGHKIAGLGQVFARCTCGVRGKSDKRVKQLTSDHLTAFDDKSVGMINRNIESQRLQHHIFVFD